MARKAYKKTGKSVAEIVTEKILIMLEQGEIPWQKPWACLGGMPKSFAGREYRGINVLLLALSARQGPFITAYMVKKLKGKIKEGEEDNWTLITFFKILKKERKNSAGQNEKYSIPLMRYTKVYSLDQVEGVPEPAWLIKERSKVEVKAHTPIQACDALWDAYASKPPMSHGGDRAFYSPSEDRIGMPTPEAFTSSEAYYSTLFHEATHSTGHTSRLGRFDTKQAVAPFGSEDYSKEELVAEIGSSMLSAHAGIECQDVQKNSVAYIQNWVKRIKADPDLIVKAAGQAQKAVDHILGTTFETRD